jgi:PAS domain S-box-containing protein
VKIESLLKKSNILNKHLTDLYQTANILPWIPFELVPQAFKELYVTSKQLKLVSEELYEQNQELIKTRQILETEHQKYQELFQLAPIAHIITNQQGIIKQGNLAAAELLNISPQFLLGKPLTNFIPREQHENFYNLLMQIPQLEQVKEVLLSIKPRHQNSCAAVFLVKNIPHQDNQQQYLYWTINKLSDQHLQQFTEMNNCSELEHKFVLHKYSKGENICLHPQLIWYVKCGLIKLSTFSETEQEIVTGLVTPEMVFSSVMTELQTYQATALTDVELIAIPVSQLEIFSSLKEIIFAKNQQRLQQTEYLLFIIGQRSVYNRLRYLLEYLKGIIGEPVSGGIRLKFRLTHEDIASICGTTRVTITRLISELQQQNIIKIDHKKHIVLSCL